MNHKPFMIPKPLVWEAWKRVKAAKGGPGVDNITLERYEENLGPNLYKLWNRMSSGTYFPKPVKQVAIPKAMGTRLLGVPTVEDRIAQTTVKLKLEEVLEKVFLQESYGARPNRSAHDAIEACKQGCWGYDWAIDLDIKSYFDSIDHNLLMKAVKKHTTTRWENLYIERWLNAPILAISGELEEKNGRGIPQGATISPLLSNLFLHYALDIWIKRTFDNIQFERFLDDCVIHCKTKNQAEYVLRKIRLRLMSIGLNLNEDKTSLVMCLTKGRRKRWGNSHNVKFTFLGYEFKPRCGIKPSGERMITFSPSVSLKACTKLLDALKKKKAFLLTHLPLEDVARIVNPIIRGWMNYFGAFRPSGMQFTLHRVNRMIGGWMMRKYRLSKRKAQALSRRLSKERPTLFHHWKLGYAT